MIDWLENLVIVPSAGQSVFVICLTAFLGLLLGRLRIGGVGVGIAGVLFAGLAFGHFGVSLDHAVMDFAREAGLILFVYTIGLQLGPSFISSLRRQGLKLNLLAGLVVLLGLGTVLVLLRITGMPIGAAAGIYTGAVTNTPALGAAQEALQGLPDIAKGQASLPGLAYAMAYPFGVVGIILSILVIRGIFRISPAAEERKIAEAEEKNRVVLGTLNLLVRNSNLAGRTLREVPGAEWVTVSRIMKSGEVRVATPETALDLGDTILVVGAPEDLEKLRVVVGEISPEDLRKAPGPVSAMRILVTRKDVIGRNLGSLREMQAVTVTRVERNGVELMPSAALALQIGDLLMVVGETDGLARARELLGDSPKALLHLEIGPMFVGIALGVILGSIPIALGNLPAPVKLGLAGGPLIVGMLLSRLGKFAGMVWYMPPNANLMLREAGIVLFLSCVGLKAGHNFVQTLVEGPGLQWMACGAVVTLLPLLVAGVIGHVVMKLNYLTLAGTMAGSMTDPPALAFANAMTSSNGPALAYATVYPAAMVLRLVSAQILVLVFGGG